MTQPEYDPIAGKVTVLSSGVRCILAPNPSPMTYRGTNTYIIGQADVAIIDPGPIDPAHQAAILAAVAGQTVSHIIVTHSHLDHSLLARPLANITGAQIVAFGKSEAGRSDAMRALATQGLAGGGEGVDHDFVPDICVADGDIIKGNTWRLEVMHTPGHMGNHIALCLDDIMFTGDLVMGWASSLVSPPDGDLDDFLASCRRVLQRQPRVLYAGHGAPIDDPAARIAWLIDHRQGRTSQILAALTAGPNDVAAITKLIYHDAPSGLLAAAARNVFAHLVSLHQSGQITAHPTLQADAIFARC